MTRVVVLNEAGDPLRFGRKAAGLADLSRVAGVRVPEGFAVDAAAFEETLTSALPPAQWPARVAHGDPSGRKAPRLDAIRRRLQSAPLPDALVAELSAAWQALGADAVAVRSSGLHEDTEAASAAGLQETVLGVRDFDGLLDALRRCWASLYGERAVAYLARHAPGARVSMAVVVQRLVPATTAGVLFTADPVDGRRDVAVIEAAPGLGCAVVDGGTSPDVFRVERASGTVLQQRVGDKRARVVADPAGGLAVRPLDADEAAAPCLTAAHIASLLRAAEAIETAAGAPRDIEWAFADDALWVLQARPIVGLRPSAEAKGDDDPPGRWVWSNVNVGEALPGVATPLTWSIAAAFSDKGFRSAFSALGCTLPPRTELIGSFYGRIYLNLTHFMRVARQVPLFEPRMLLEFGGGAGLEAIESQVEPGQWGPFLLRLPGVGARLAVDNLSLDGRLSAFERDFERTRHDAEGTRLDALSQDALQSLWRQRMALLDRTGTLMLTCASGYLGSVVALRTLLQRVLGAEAERYERELLGGLADLESAAPGIALVHIGAMARTEPAARAALLSRDPATLRVDDLPDGPTRRAFRTFLRAFGFRCVREAELSTPRWREAPGPLFAALRAYVETGDDRALHRVERQGTVRAQSEAALEARLPPVGRSLVRHLLGRTQRFARLRERLRARVTEALGLLREVALEASRRLAQREPGIGDDAAFYLTAEELEGWLGGEHAELRGLVATRRAQVLRDAARPDPPTMFVGSPPSTPPPTLATGDRWQGVAAAGGVVTGVVRVLRTPEEGAELRPGEVLVTSVADVGWTPLFLVAAAVVTELGGALSHAALVAREYGVPTVANIQGITRALRTGDRVRVDGDRGIVERLAPECPT